MKKTILLPLAFCISFHISAISQDQSGDTLSFLHITDTHISNLADYHADIAGRRKHYGQGEQPFANFIAHSPGKSGASFIALTGDMIDFYEGQTQSDEMRTGQVENFAKLLSSSSVPVYMTLGNHDIKSVYNSQSSIHHSKPYYAADEKARAAWVLNVPCFRNGLYYSKIVKVGSTTYRLLFLDTSYYKEKTNRDSGLPFTIDLRQLTWLKNQLSESTKDVEILFMHMPLPWENPETEVSSFTNFSPEDSGFYNLLEEHPTIRLILTGHEHFGKLKDFKTKSGRITQIMTGAFGRDPNNWRLVHLTKDGILISETGDIAIQKVIKTRP